ncbi:MAG: hypothetical protein ACREM6_16885 [Vulcanimicrobiaceae bacterium]
MPPAVPNVVQTNPPGDIPDTQLFVTYRSANGYSVLFPEGWSRASSGSTVTFRSNYDGEQITTRSKSDPNATVRALFPSAANMKVTHVTLHGTPATLVSFRSHSNSNAVTGRSVTLENQSFVFLHGTHEAVLSLWAPQGSDNVDQWRKISQSFHWK